MNINCQAARAKLQDEEERGREGGGGLLYKNGLRPFLVVLFHSFNHLLHIIKSSDLIYIPDI